uniref:Uncharacterized protein n=1 Tax=Octopus bimaculoides TaxID=37653 RepID=A0A0L8HNX4_OCTBM
MILLLLSLRRNLYTQAGRAMNSFFYLKMDIPVRDNTVSVKMRLYDMTVTTHRSNLTMT